MGMILRPLSMMSTVKEKISLIKYCRYVAVFVLVAVVAFWLYPGNAEAAVPPQVTLISPSNGATSISTAPTLSWNAASMATWYQVQISRDPNFTNLILDQVTSGTSLQVRSPLLPSAERLLDLGRATQYWWRVRGMNASLISGPWSVVRSFTTNARRVWSPVVHQVDIGRNFYHFQGRWDSAAVNWFVQEQRYVTELLRHRIWWEAEVRFISPTNHHGQIYTGSSHTFTNMPSHNFEFGSDEMGHQTRRPDQLVANTLYFGDRTLLQSPSQPLTFTVDIESEITDWAPTGHPIGQWRAHWDVRGQIVAPAGRIWTIN